MHWFFLFFIASGFCSLVYQVVWLRVSMAAFGVTTPAVSIILSVFMAGLALGSWGAGRFAGRDAGRRGATFLRAYALAELLIGVSGLVVAPLLETGRNLLNAAEGPWGSGGYYLASGGWITLILLPFCTCMGATFPLAMAALRRVHSGKAATSFSYLYLANLLGAMAGALASAFVMIETLGFRGTMMTAAALNLVIAVVALLVSSSAPYAGAAPAPAAAPETPITASSHGRRLLLLLFVTGLVSLAMEVVWTRQFVPFQGPVVYTFASILAIYLAATLVGSQIYRRWFREHRLFAAGAGWQLLTALAGLAALLPLLTADYRLPLPDGLLAGTVRVLCGIGPFCGLLGFLTPGILDRLSKGDPRRAGSAYALNTIGCIIGPLLAGFLLLPRFSERWTLTLLAAPLFLLAALPDRPAAAAEAPSLPRWQRLLIVAGLPAAALVLTLTTRDFERRYPDGVVRRDHTATVVATGSGMRKRLFVNGVGITHLTPITKMMAHLPLASLDRNPRQGLVLCLGMGTSFRSMLSWGIPTTVVELVPSVPALLPYFHADGERLLQENRQRIIVDDARRFLERSKETFDVIVIDPPPPVEAAASSLLYSREFYRTAAKRLSPDGICQQWIPGADPYVEAAMVKAMIATFPYVRAFRSIDGWGVHLLGSRQPIPFRTPADLAARLPAAAARDIVEWGPFATPEEQFAALLWQMLTVEQLLSRAPTAPAISDDRPVNEYYLLRKLFPAPGPPA